jgi:threonine aldolase
MDSLISEISRVAPVNYQETGLQSASHPLSKLFFDPNGFREKFDDPSLIWAIDLCPPPHEEYTRVLKLSESTIRNGYQWGQLVQLSHRYFSEIFTGDPDRSDVVVLFTPTGTSANRLCTTPVLNSDSSMVVNRISHAVEREAGAVASQTGSTLHILPTSDLIDPRFLDTWLTKRFSEYWITQPPRVVGITNPMEDGSIYTENHLRALGAVCKKHGVLLQVDGVRLFLAAAALGCTLKELTTDVGVDMLALGGSKCGMYHAEAAVFLPSFFQQYQKSHLFSPTSHTWQRMRSYLKREGNLVAQSEGAAAQFIRAFIEDFGIQLGRNINKAAVLLANGLETIPECTVVNKVETNVVLASLSPNLFEYLNLKYREMKTTEEASPARPDDIVVRFVTNHATTEKDISDTITYLRKYVPKLEH